MRRDDPIARVARGAIGRAKRRVREEVTPDDLLVAALGELARFGVAWVGPWAVDVASLDGAEQSGKAGKGASPVDEPASRPRYSEAAVDVFEAAARVAREDGAESLGLVHLLVALGEREDGLMERLADRHDFGPGEWRAALARGEFGPGPGVSDGGSPVGSAAAGEGAGAKTPELLSVDRAASFLGVHAQTVRNYIRAGKLPAYRLAGERFIRVLRRDLLALLEPVDAEDAQEEEAPGVELPIDPSLEEA